MTLRMLETKKENNSMKPLTKLPKNLKDGDVLVVLKKGCTTETEEYTVRPFPIQATGEYDVYSSGWERVFASDKYGRQRNYLMDGREETGMTGPVVSIIRKTSDRGHVQIQKVVAKPKLVWEVVVTCRNRAHAREIAANIDNGLRKVRITRQLEGGKS